MGEGKEDEEKPNVTPEAVVEETTPEGEAEVEAEPEKKGKKKKAKKEKKEKKPKEKKPKKEKKEKKPKAAKKAKEPKEATEKETEIPEKPKSRYYPEFEEALESQQGKVVVITGTTSGTGLVAATAALKKGAKVILLNRNEAKARKALEKCFAENQGTQDRAHFVTCDLQNFESVKKAAEIVKDLCKDTGIDVLVNNAGVMALEDKATEDGYDVQMQTNHLSHFLLTKMLYELLEKRAQEKGEARVVNHSSGARRMPMTPLKAKYLRKNGGKLGGNGNSMVFGGARWQRYHQSKLANSVFTMEMKRRFEKAGSKVKSVCAYPGFAATELQVTTQKDGGLKSLGFMKKAQSQEDGAMGLIKCMFDVKAENGDMYGPYMTKGEARKRNHGMLTTRRAGGLLWKESEAACGEFEIPKVVVAAES